jgi:hypothetical protein
MSGTTDAAAAVPTINNLRRVIWIASSRPDDQVPVFGELENARKVIADEEVSRNRSLHVMG